MAKFNSENKIWEAAKFPYPFSLDTYLGEEMLKKLKDTPERVCQVSVEDNYKLTCNELRVKSVRVAQNLTKLGVQPKDVVGIICRHSHDLTIALYACVFIGAPVNPLDLSFTKRDIKNLFGQTQPRLVICDNDQVMKLREALSELNSDAKIYSIATSTNEETNFSELLTPTGMEEEFVAPKFDQSADEKILAILSSSGTTGSPKGVMIMHCSLLARTPMFKFMPKTEARSLCFGPFFYSSGFFPHLFVAFKTYDLHIISHEDFSLQKFIEINARYKPTELTVPPMYLTIILQSDFSRTADHQCLKTVACVGSIVTESLRSQFAELFPDKNMLIFYGMTEGSVSMTLPGEYKEKLTVGSFVFPNLTVKIVDDDGERLGSNESGEICIKSTMKFPGYYNNSEATKSAIDEEGFYKSGDLGYFDDNGKLHIIDRKKEIMQCSGYLINLSEIENLVESIEGVKYVSVVGIPDTVYVHLPAALVVKRRGFESLTESYIADFVASQFPIYKHLTGGVFFADNLPRTPSGKVKKNLVSQIVISRLALNQ